MKPSIDIIVPVKNNTTSKNYSIYYTLKSLLCQRKVKYKVFIIDDFSDDDTYSQIKSDFGQYQNIHILKNTEKGVANARNHGALRGESGYILFIDDDTVLGHEETLFDVYQNSQEFDFSCGANRFWTPSNWPEYLLKEDIFKSWSSILGKISFLPKGVDRITGLMDLTHVTFIGNFGFIKRSIFKEIGGFPITYKGWGLEDTHLMFILCLKGYHYCLLKDKNISVYHLNHAIGKHDSFLNNLQTFRIFQREVGIEFNEAAFFNEFDGVHPILKKANL